MTKFKVLKHKTEPETFGSLYHGLVWQGQLPQPFALTAELENILPFLNKEEEENLKNYELVVVEIKECDE